MQSRRRSNGTVYAGQGSCAGWTSGLPRRAACAADLIARMLSGAKNSAGEIVPAFIWSG